MADESCPICKSHLTGESTPENPVWKDDPLRTPRGLAGTEYVGHTPIRAHHIVQLQQYYQYLQEQLSLPITSWLPITDTQPIKHQHIEQLRQVVEDLLEVRGWTIADYFTSDKIGAAYTTSQTDWTDVYREGDRPSILPPNTPIKAIHIEELRRGISFFYGILFCSTGFYNYLTGQPLGQDYQGLGRVGQPPYQYFKDYKNFLREPPENYIKEGYTLNNTFACLISQFGRLHSFGTGRFDMTGEPKYKSCLCSDLSITGWDESEGGGTPVEFSPSLPFLFTNSDNHEGILGITIDDNYPDNLDGSSDYIMYTTEFFYQRLGYTQQTYQDWGEPSFIGGGSPQYVTGTPSYLAKYSAPKKRYLGISLGGSNQTFHYPERILDDSDKVYTLSTSGTQLEWSRVTDFSTSLPNSRHYTINYNTQTIQFGDGVTGRIPPIDSQVILFITLMGGNIWQFESIIVPPSSNIRLYGPQASHGKLWYCRINNAFTYATVRHQGSHAKFGGVKLSKYSVHPGTGERRLSSETWDYGIPFDSNPDGDNYLDVSGSFDYQVRHPLFGILDSHIKPPAEFVGGGGTGTERPAYTVSDSLTSYQYKIIYQVPISFGGSTPTGVGDACVTGARCYGEVMFNDARRTLVSQYGGSLTKIYQDIYYGRWKSVAGTYIWDTSDQSSYFYFEGHSDSMGNLTQIGDRVKTVNGTEWDTYYYAPQWYRETFGTDNFNEWGKLGFTTLPVFKYVRYHKGVTTNFLATTPLTMIYTYLPFSDTGQLGTGANEYPGIITSYTCEIQTTVEREEGI